MSIKPYRVLVTRPRHQADELCQLIAEQGWSPVQFPTIEIKPIEDVKLPSLSNYSSLIFTSQNSVESAFKHWNIEDFSSKQVIAIGQATAKALRTKEVKEVIAPELTSNSEQLLTLPELQADKIAKEEILILTGAGGRRFLQVELSKFAQRVETLELYARQCPCYDKLQLQQAWDVLPDVMVLTSNEAAENLKKILNSTPYLQYIKVIPSVVMSYRNQEYINAMGFNAKSWVAETTDVYGLISALKQCFDEEDSE